MVSRALQDLAKGPCLASKGHSLSIEFCICISTFPVPHNFIHFVSNLALNFHECPNGSFRGWVGSFTSAPYTKESTAPKSRNWVNEVPETCEYFLVNLTCVVYPLLNWLGRLNFHRWEFSYSPCETRRPVYFVSINNFCVTIFHHIF